MDEPSKEVMRIGYLGFTLTKFSSLSIPIILWQFSVRTVFCGAMV